MPSTQNFTDKELERSYWFVTHRLLLEKIGIGIIVGINVLLLIIGIYFVVDTFLIKYTSYRNSLRGLTQVHQSLVYAQSKQLNTVEQLNIGSPVTFNLVPGQVDVIVPITNPNSSYKADLEYRFVSGDFQTSWRSMTILPGASTYAYELGVPSEVSVRTAEIEFRNFGWDVVINYNKIKDERLNFVLEDAEFVPSVQASEEQAPVPAKVDFTVLNNSAYSYREVGYIVLLYSGNVLSGVHYVRSDNVFAGARDEIELASFDTLTTISRVEVLPDVNILDQSNIIGVR